MKSTYNYRVIKSSWGIAIDITAEVLPLADSRYAAIEVRNGLWLSVDMGVELTQQEHQMLTIGLRLLNGDLDRIVQRDGPLVIRVYDVSFNPVDYQEEGLAYALAGWAAQQFTIPLTLQPVHFLKQENRYIFELDPHPVESNARPA